MKISKVTKRNFSEWLEMGLLFYSKHPEEKIRKEFKEILDSKKEAVFIAKNEDNTPLGFMNVSIRSDYVEGSKTSPVGYIEVIYAKKEHRKKGVAKQLFKEAEKWFVQKKLSEIGSDVEIHNHISQKFHKSLGFKKGETMVHYIREL